MTVSVERALARISLAAEAARPRKQGRVRRVVGLNLEVAGLEAAIGDAIEVETPAGPLAAEVVALRDDALVCMPYGQLRGVRSGAPAVAGTGALSVPVGEAVLGRVLDGLGRPIDDGPSLAGVPRVSVDGEPPHPLRRAPVDVQLDLGVRALDALVPCGRGQRIGIFAGSGVGKSTLLSMIARGTAAQVVVLALIGERGREVREFIENDLGPEGLARSVVVVATSDEPALVRLRAAFAATRIAEWYRDQGADVLLLMDSLTRFCMAQREIGLSAGEPPATRGYPPSVFALLPRLLERAGAGETGAITGLYTVLVDGDDMNEPVADATRSLLDGHVVLSRKLATSGHYPAIEVLESVSRVQSAITEPWQRQAAVQLRRLMAAHREAKDLIEIGAYVRGSNPLVDQAVERAAAIEYFLCQDVDDRTDAAVAWAGLQQLVAGT
ncbi:MAG TPA: FliI/YscN family ATPase [Acidimicrobiales bacterium]|nr:FliI/YscN family ATPase [Acidimicrobiales bacterium]